MAFRKLFRLASPGVLSTRSTRLPPMLVRREPIVATVYRRDNYRPEVITIPRRTLL